MTRKRGFMTENLEKTLKLCGKQLFCNFLNQKFFDKSQSSEKL